LATQRKISRREAMATLGAVALSAALPRRAAHAAPQKYNVLFVVVDDLNTKLGCYGDKIVKSPNIDRLARRGILFEHAYCQYPVCNPTRSSLLTGMRPDSTGVYDNATHFRDKLPDAVTLPRLFKDNGYTVLKFGKVFHGRYGDKTAWSKWTPSKPFKPARMKGDPPPPKPKLSPEEVKRKKAEHLYSFGPADKPDEALPDGRTARMAAQAIRELKDKPFFIAVGFAKPHVPMLAPRKYFEMYPPEKMPVITGPEDDLDDVPTIAAARNFRTYFRPFLHRELTDEEAHQVVAAYFACTTYMDAQFGILLDTLEELKLADRTFIVLWGDHGWHLGEHWHWAKRTLFEESCRVPLIFAGPSVARPGKPCKGIVECVDVYPTIAEACGLPVPKGLEGVSLVPLMKDPDRPWKKCAFTQLRVGKIMGVSIRTERWRYTEWGSPDVAELYDHETGPREYRNLAKDPAHAETVRELSALLHAGWKAALPS